jgi:hypothetical protein
VKNSITTGGSALYNRKLQPVLATQWRTMGLYSWT